MKRVRFATVAWVAVVSTSLAAVSAAPPLFGPRTEPEAAGVKWQTSLPDAHKIAVTQNKPLLLVFGAEWCGWCKRMEKQTLNTPEISGYINSGFIPIQLDLDKEKRVAEILEVTSLPCIIVLSPNADLLGRIDGYLAPQPFQEKLVEARSNFQRVGAAVPVGTTR